MDLLVGGDCPVCSYKKTFQNPSVIRHLKYSGCPNCGFGYCEAGILEFDVWSKKTIGTLSQFIAKLEVNEVGVEPDNERQPDRDPYYSILADMIKFYQKELYSLPIDQLRVNLLQVSTKFESSTSDNLFDYPQEVIDYYKSTHPEILKK